MLGHRAREYLAIDCQGTSCRNRTHTRNLQQHRAEIPQLALELASSGDGIIALERVRTHEFSKRAAVMRGALFVGPHLEKSDGYPAFRELPSGLRTRKSAPNDRDRLGGAKSGAMCDIRVFHGCRLYIDICPGAEPICQCSRPREAGRRLAPCHPVTRGMAP